MKTRQLRLDAPIFIGGASSSGNTLLARMFSRHPDVFCGQEMSLFNKQRIYSDFNVVKRMLPVWLKRGLPTDGYSQYAKIIPEVENGLLTRDLLLHFASRAGSLRDFVDQIQAHCLSKSGKSVLAEKTPSDVYCFRQLAALYPNCVLIHSVRDGRDVVCSLMKRGYDIFQATSIWLFNATSGIGCRDLPNYIEVRYEELVQDPQAIVPRICEKASIPYDPCMLQPAEGEQVSRFAAAGYWKNSTSDHVSQTSVGRYEAELSDADYAAFCSVQLTKVGARTTGTSQLTAFELLQSLGYSAELQARRASFVRSKFLEMQDRLRQNSHLIRRGYLPRRALTQVTLRSANRTKTTDEPVAHRTLHSRRQKLARTAAAFIFVLPNVAK